jgi:diaminopimelate decarboxylase/aspartate kinase
VRREEEPVTRTPSAWIVLKFGGTSVSSLANWRNIAKVARARLDSGARVLIVHSAVTGITDRLEKLLDAALAQTHEADLRAIEERHVQLAAELGIPLGAEVERYLAELRHIAAGVALVGEVSDRTRARVMSAGELIATELGSRFLRTQGLEVDWADARKMLRAEERRGATSRSSILSATCAFGPDGDLETRLGSMAPVVITQGFIASDDDGNTVLLGRGGSDTSGAYFAAKIRAQRLEIWTDVPGMFSANPRSTPTARLLRNLHYDEAQEIATSGAKVLHPRCILPARTPRRRRISPAPFSARKAARVVRRSRPSARRRASRSSRWKAPGCGTRSVSWLMHSRYSKRTECQSTSCRHRRRT